MNKITLNSKIYLTGAALALVVALQTFTPVWANPTDTRPAEADKLHVILLMAGNDGGIGSADKKDVAAVKKAISTAFAQDKSRVVYHDLSRVNPKTHKVYSSDEILAHLRGMKVGKNDNILVYHSGHGGIRDRRHPEESHILVVDGGDLQRKEGIRAILSAKQPRALMILTDCCSSYMNEPEALVALQRKAPKTSVNVYTVRGLLLKTVGLVNITAAADGTEATASFKGENPGQAGSAFTVALLRLWYRQDTTYNSWEKMFPTLRTETSRASGGQHQARAFQINTHLQAAAAPAGLEF